jgi:hypothetical protein
MLVFRSIALGLLGAIAWFLATRASPVTRIQHERELVAVANHAAVPTIIDVAPGLSATQIAQLVRLGPDERVTSVDDHAVTGNLDAGTVIGAPAGRRFLDLTIGRAHSERRVLLLIH